MKEESSDVKPQKNNQNQLRDRCKANETFFSSFIDLIPSTVYLNTDDRRNWIHIVSNESRKKKSNMTNGKNGVHHSDDSEVDDEDVEMEEEENLDVDFRLNKFDPKYFKTVTQILNDFEVYHQKNKKKIQQQINLNKAKMIKASQNGQNKSTAIKVQNKSQHKSLSKNQNSEKSEDTNEESEEVQNGEKTKSSESSKKAQKRASKFKEEKRAAIKRQRLRYDSQSETQIVDIDHSEANSTEKRKPILNKNGEVVYSKFDFTADKTLKTKKKDEKLTPVNAKPKDYKKLLKKLQEKKEKVEELKKSEPEKAQELELKSKWRTALDKASGIKVKDDVNLLKKTVKRMEKKKEKAKKNWDERKKAVDERKNKAQEKRRKNLDKRKEKNKEKKIKLLKKKGRILPGF
ncbi:unnamed protein product [Brachionus calyciflorus]|uniref:Ribosomal RNA-processing protein 14/surfeit locus protein 6 C-terminal domain-containing protein n=1 Tax=Brachionus calyciflorus TaxID=104777 RepID=A0A814DDT0_9BILA|nr:unnamed protein product [Brachionus calyciflorus]